jgi:D-serine deaminase-like pyridoxal phosphate-dependent protein
MHHEESPLNDYSVGSALVKPVGFDLPGLEQFKPAAWIAAPVLKRSAGVRIPFIEKLPSHGRDTLFIYGGKWMAEPCYPEGLSENSTYGVSSNQQMLTVPQASGIAVDDYVFLRPTQSEAVFLQFGDLCIVRGDRHVANWPVFRNRGFPAGAC